MQDSGYGMRKILFLVILGSPLMKGFLGLRKYRTSKTKNFKNLVSINKNYWYFLNTQMQFCMFISNENRPCLEFCFTYELPLDLKGGRREVGWLCRASNNTTLLMVLKTSPKENALNFNCLTINAYKLPAFTP